MTNKNRFHHILKNQYYSFSQVSDLFSTPLFRIIDLRRWVLWKWTLTLSFSEKSRKIKTETKIYIHVLCEFIAMNGFNMKMKSWQKIKIKFFKLHLLVSWFSAWWKKLVTVLSSCKVLFVFGCILLNLLSKYIKTSFFYHCR